MSNQYDDRSKNTKKQEAGAKGGKAKAGNEGKYAKGNKKQSKD